MPTTTPPAEEIDLTEEEDAALDAAVDKLAAAKPELFAPAEPTGV